MSRTDTDTQRQMQTYRHTDRQADIRDRMHYQPHLLVAVRAAGGCVAGDG